MSVIIKNDSGSTKVYGGVEIADQAQYTIQEIERSLFSTDDALITDIGSQDAIINDGTNDLGISDGMDHLKGYMQKAPVDSEGTPINKASAFHSSDGFRARLHGNEGTATAGQTTNIDFLISQERYVNGVRVMLVNHVDGDKMNFEVVDVDNILGYGAGLVLDQFGKDWYIDSNICTQPDVIIPYPAKVIAGLYIRLAYVSVGVTNVTVRSNMYLHWKQV